MGGPGGWNERKIVPGDPRKQILGIYVKEDNYLDMIKYQMFKLTKKNPEDRVPIYLADGSVGWPRG